MLCISASASVVYLSQFALDTFQRGYSLPSFANVHESSSRLSIPTLTVYEIIAWSLVLMVVNIPVTYSTFLVESNIRRCYDVLLYPLNCACNLVGISGSLAQLYAFIAHHSLMRLPLPSGMPWCMCDDVS